jgi:hypothetical protein
VYLHLLVSGLIPAFSGKQEIIIVTMNKTIRIIGIISIALLFIGAFMRFFYIPNQLIILGAGIVLFILIILPSFLVFNLKRSASWKEKLMHIAGFLICVTFIIFFGIILQRNQAVFTVIAIVSGILTLAYFILLLLKRTDIIDEKIKWPFLASYLSVVILVFLNLPVEIQGAAMFYNPPVPDPSYERGQGPVIYIDQGHYNFHTLNGRLRSTGHLLKRDGYNVRAYDGQFETEKLKDCKILMIVNALNDSNVNRWIVPIYSAFTDEEIEVVRDWVSRGGSLFLVADHMPLAGAAAKLASQFGFTLHNGYALDTMGRADYFVRSDSSLHENIITNGKNSGERVDSILTFTGHAFEIPGDAIPIMIFPEGYLQWCPDTAARFTNIIPEPVTGLYQGAFKKYGHGRVVILGEAMMITAQLGYGLSWIRIGMNSPGAPYNHQLLLNIIHWLDGKIGE